jgi:hypothetical protein
MTTYDTFAEVLESHGRAPEIASADDVYGWLIGGWELDVMVYDPQGGVHESKGEAHFSWVLDGRAVQDVFINPRRADRTPALAKIGSNWYGSTFRVYDPSIKAWRVTWINPVTGAGAELIGRWQGKEIVQEGRYSDGASIRWTFTDIGPESFRWLGERQESDGLTWRLQVEFVGRRMK